MGRTYIAFGEIRITELRVIHIQSFIDSLGETGVNSRTGGGLSPKTVRGYLNFISDVMRYAWRLELIVSNPCERVTLPPLQKKEPAMYSETQMCDFLHYLKDAPTKYQAFFQIAIFAGLRRGELLGLDWADVDFDHFIITVQKNSQYTKRKGIYCEGPKTNAGYRVLKLPEILFCILKKLQQEQYLWCVRNGADWAQSLRLFTGSTGQPMHPNTPYNWLKRFCARKGLPFHGIHQFRHLNASLLICNGADPKTVAYSLGHTQVSTTLNIYAHAFAHEQAKASEAVGRSLEQKYLIGKR